MKNKALNTSPLIQFLFKFMGLLLLWEVLYSFWLEPNGKIDFYLTKFVSDSSVWVLNLFGYNISSFQGVGQTQIFFLDNIRVLLVAHPCNGLMLLVLFIAFLICFSGNFWVKLISVLIGCCGIFVINIVRIVLLTLIKLYYPAYLDFSHKWLFTVIVYAFVFSLWILWVNKLSKIKIGRAQK